jgi:hypothetical protein
MIGLEGDEIQILAVGASSGFVHSVQAHLRARCFNRAGWQFCFPE